MAKYSSVSHTCCLAVPNNGETSQEIFRGVLNRLSFYCFFKNKVQLNQNETDYREACSHSRGGKCGKVKFFTGVAFPPKNGFLQLGHLTLSRPWINDLTSSSLLSWPILSILPYCSSVAHTLYKSRLTLLPAVQSGSSCRPLFLFPWGLNFSVCLVILVVVFIEVWPKDIKGFALGLWPTLSFQTLSVYLMFIIRLRYWLTKTGSGKVHFIYFHVLWDLK